MSPDEAAQSDVRDGERVKGADEIVIERRLSSIFDIRDEIHNLRKRLRMGRLDGLTEFQVLSGYRTLVDNYAMELHPLLLKYEAGEQLLNEHDFGEAYVNPRIETRKTLKGRSRVLKRPVRGDIETQGDPEIVAFELTGLKSLWELPDPLEATIGISRRDAATMSTKTEQVRVSDQIGLQKLDEMVREMNVFLSEIGFELEPETTQEWEI